MKELRFEQIEDSTTWQCGSLQLLYETKSKDWILTEDNKPYIYKSIYDVIAYLGLKGYHANFRLPNYMDNVPTEN